MALAYSVSIVDIQRSCSISIVYSCVLKTPHLTAGKNIFEIKELYVHLDAMARHLFFIALKRQLVAFTLVLGQLIQPVSLPYTVNTALRYFDVIIAL
jgi:hypothetical protein